MSAAIVAAALGAGALGAVVRYAVTRAVARGTTADSPARIPRAVLIVNIVGSLVAGALLAVPGDLQYVLVSGFAAGLTTFSTWTVETVQLVLDGKAPAAIANVLVNLVAGLAAALAAFALVSALL